MKRTLLLFLLTAIINVGAAFAGPKDSLGVIQVKGEWLLRYKVKQGETLNKLASKYHTSLDKLLSLNPDAEFGLREGMELLIPSKHKEKKAVADAMPVPHKEGSKQKTQTQPAEEEEEDEEEEEIEATQKAEPSQATNQPSSDKTKEIIKPTQPPANLAKPNDEEDFGAGKHYNSSDDQGQSLDDSTLKKVLIIPFDPYKYFSDADDEIAQRSRISKAEVRQFFRSRLSTVMAPNKYETLHLMGTPDSDTARDLDKMYLSIGYKYANPIINTEKPQLQGDPKAAKKQAPGMKEWIKTQTAKIQPDAPVKPRPAKGLARFDGKFFHAEIKDTTLIKYFNKKYGVDYYVFLNQFEVKTNYDNCIDRARQDYERNFIVHYTIYKKNGKVMAGNSAKIFYNSNSNSILQIVNDNMQKLANTVLAELP